MRSEKEKMLAGELYDAQNPQLVLERRRARELLRDLNATRDADATVRAEIIRALFGAAGEGVLIEPPFFCDYGSNIRLGDRVFFNFNCVVLDVAEVVIGSDVMFGSAFPWGCLRLTWEGQKMKMERRQHRKELSTILPV